MRAFQDDLTGAKLDDRVAVLCFSEFGRRVEENGSSGTDHGTAGPVFLVGSRVQGGLVGTAPSLVDLDPEGDLKMTVDFRGIYASVLEEWLGIPRKRLWGSRTRRCRCSRCDDGTDWRLRIGPGACIRAIREE